MRRCRPLALDDQQMRIVLSGAAQLCATSRADYLQRVADQLGRLDSFSDDHVQQAVTNALATLEDAA